MIHLASVPEVLAAVSLTLTLIPTLTLILTLYEEASLRSINFVSELTVDTDFI